MQKESGIVFSPFLGQSKGHGIIKFQTILLLINNAARSQITGRWPWITEIKKAWCLPMLKACTSSWRILNASNLAECIHRCMPRTSLKESSQAVQDGNVGLYLRSLLRVEGRDGVMVRAEIEREKSIKRGHGKRCTLCWITYDTYFSHWKVSKFPVLWGLQG